MGKADALPSIATSEFDPRGVRAKALNWITMQWVLQQFGNFADYK
jgi:hypothetical protein